jgi:hypothetical protein
MDNNTVYVKKLVGVGHNSNEKISKNNKLV